MPQGSLSQKYPSSDKTTLACISRTHTYTHTHKYTNTHTHTHTHTYIHTSGQIRYFHFFSLDGVVLNIRMWKQSTLKTNLTLITMKAFIFVFSEFCESCSCFSYHTHLSPPPPYLTLNIWTIWIYSHLMYETRYKKNNCLKKKSNYCWKRYLVKV